MMSRSGSSSSRSLLSVEEAAADASEEWHQRQLAQAVSDGITGPPDRRAISLRRNRLPVIILLLELLAFPFCLSFWGTASVFPLWTTVITNHLTDAEMTLNSAVGRIAPTSDADAAADAATTTPIVLKPGQPQRLNTRVVGQSVTHAKEGVAACLLVLDDTARLTEWIAYHYTTLPLSTLVLALDPNNKPSSEERIERLAGRWVELGVNVTLWYNDTFLLEEQQVEMARTDEDYRKHKIRQCAFVNLCMEKLHRDGRQWVLLTDTDEFLVPNYIHDDENYDLYDTARPGNWQPHIDKERARVAPIRQRFTSIRANPPTVLSLLKNESSLGRCLRIPGLFFGAEDSKNRNTEHKLSPEAKKAVGNASRLMTWRYRRHGRREGHFSKVMIDLIRVDPSWFRKSYCNTIHNPNFRICGNNGNAASGADYISSVFRINHYLGSPESFLERSGDVRGRNLDKYNVKNSMAGPYYETDSDILPWINSFVSKVGVEDAKRLLETLDIGF